MKKTKRMMKLWAVVLFLTAGLASSNASAQSKVKETMMKDCCMMKDGKMLCVKDGKTMPMDQDMIMKNGTTCMVNGDCVMKDGTKMTMKDGDCMDMNGTINQCSMMNKSKKMTTKTKPTTMAYTCPMHAEIIRDKPGKCPKCGMDLVKK